MLSEWHLSPDEILHHWTEERLDLFWQKRNERMRRLSVMTEDGGEDVEQKPRYVSNREFFTAPIPGSHGRTIANPNATRLKRVQVMK
jgi:hypothetical protein